MIEEEEQWANASTWTTQMIYQQKHTEAKFTEETCLKEIPKLREEVVFKFKIWFDTESDL